MGPSFDSAFKPFATDASPLFFQKPSESLLEDASVAKPSQAAQGKSEPHQELLDGLSTSPKSIPCSYLYDQVGSNLYDQIVELPEYYPYKTELHMLEHNAVDIIKQISPGSVIVELGCGSATKTRIILDALLARAARCILNNKTHFVRDGPAECYYEGIDCSSDFLQLARSNLLSACPTLDPINVGTICALYLEGLEEARRRHPGKVLCILWLGSSVGNLNPDEALQFFKDMLRIGGSSTQVLLCTDLWKDEQILHAAYHDSKGITESFIKNGLIAALGALAPNLKLRIEDWKYEVIVNAEKQQVEMWLKTPYEVSVCKEVTIHAGEMILMEVSRKFTPRRLRVLAFQAGWYWQASWSTSKYSLQMLHAPKLALQNCWLDTDALFNSMPDWSDHPISIRHPFCFYYGHVAAFLKSRAMPQAEATFFDKMFSRGIDPDVLEPSKCHDHPDAPSEWPSKGEIIAYVDQVRQELLEAIDDGQVSVRNLCLALEHERMHQETLAYMQAQQRKRSFESLMPNGANTNSSRPQSNGHKSEMHEAPLGGTTKTSNGHHANGNGNANACNGHGLSANGNGNANACNGRGLTANGHGDSSNRHDTSTNGYIQANGKGAPATNGNYSDRGGKFEMSVCPAGSAVLGVPLDGDASFVWDNEGPQQAPVLVKAFSAAAYPVTVFQFRKFALDERGYDCPKWWSPTDYAHFHKSGQKFPATWTVEGDEVWVHTNLSTKHWTEVADQPVWVSLAEAQAFCAANGARLMTEPEYHRLLDHNSVGNEHRWLMLRRGGWEWTSTEFAPLAGFKPMVEYPEYSADFFDGNHAVLKGAAPVTHPSMVRDSFRNFYQGQYPFVFAKFRCCQ